MTTLKSIVIGVLFFALIVGGLSLFMNSVVENYNVTGTQDLSTSNATQDTIRLIENLRNSTESTQVNTGIAVVDAPINIITSLTAGAYNTLRLLFATMDIFPAMITDLAAKTGLPFGWAINILYFIALGIVIFAILRVIFKLEV